jgi:hypothetical protein
LLLPLILFFVLLKNNIGANKIEHIFKILAFSNIIACLTAIYFYNNSSNNLYLMFFNGVAYKRMLGAFQQANVFANYIAVTFPFVLVILKKKRIINKLFFVLFLLLNIYCLYYSYSRWTMISIVLATIILCIILNKKKISSKKFKRIIIVVFVAAILICYMIVNLGKINSTIYLSHRNSTDIRYASILNALSRASSYAFMGNGLGLGLGNEVLDSTLMNLLIDTGIFGVLIYFILFGYMLHNSRKICKIDTKIENLTIMYSLMIFFFLSVLENVIYNTLINSFVGLYLFYIVSYKRIENKT